MTAAPPLRIGFIPLVDAAALFVAADKGFAAAEGLEIELVREISWSNIRDRLTLGHLDAAHLLAPMAVASQLGLGCPKISLAAPMVLAANGGAITVAPALHEELRAVAGDPLTDPQASAKALGEIVRRREARGLDPLTFGMTFPFSSHNYQLRYWMAEGGVDPDRDLQLVVLPPPYMVESLAGGHVDGFCVGAPWSSVAVASGAGVILHFGCEIFASAPEKLLALRRRAIDETPERAAALTRAVAAGADYAAAPENRDEVVRILARADRVGADATAIQRVLDGCLPINAAGEQRARADYVVIGGAEVSRPHPVHAAWLLAQMLRWSQAKYSEEILVLAESVMRGDLYDAALGRPLGLGVSPWEARAFSGPTFNASDLRGYVNAFHIGAKI